MGVYCDECGVPLPPNDERTYTRNGGALCPKHQLEYRRRLRRERLNAMRAKTSIRKQSEQFYENQIVR
jgi:uncharacterized Zn finger protein (UPF0148 family)